MKRDAPTVDIRAVAAAGKGDSDIDIDCSGEVHREPVINITFAGRGILLTTTAALALASAIVAAVKDAEDRARERGLMWSQD